MIFADFGFKIYRSAKANNMRVILIISLAGIFLWAMSERWGLLAVIIAIAIGLLIKTDPQGKSIDDFFAFGFLICILGGAVAVIRAIIL